MTMPKNFPWDSKKICRLCHYYLPLKWKSYHPECMKLIQDGKFRVLQANRIIWNARQVGEIVIDEEVQPPKGMKGTSLRKKRIKLTPEMTDEDIIIEIPNFWIDVWTDYEPKNGSGFRYVGTSIEIWREETGLKAPWAKRRGGSLGLGTIVGAKHRDEAESAQNSEE